MMTRPLITGLGSHHGDDQAGWLVIDQLQERGYPASHLVRLRKPADLLDVFEADQNVGWNQRRFVAPAHNEPAATKDGGPTLEARLSRPTLSNTLIICDACVGDGSSVGTVHRFRWPSDKLAYQRPSGSHDQSLAEVMSLGQQFGSIPKAAQIWTITAGSWTAGSEPSREIIQAAEQVADLIWKELPSA